MCVCVCEATLSITHISLYSVYVCACVRACARILRIVTLESLSTLCVSFFLSFCLTYVFIADDISISMYIMFAILCLLSS